MKVNHDLGDPDDPAAQLLHRAWLAYLSDDLPTDSVLRAHPVASKIVHDGTGQTGSSRPVSTTRSGSIARYGPTVGISTTSAAITSSVVVASRSATSSPQDGLHVATVAQEVLIRDRSARPSAPAPDAATPTSDSASDSASDSVSDSSSDSAGDVARRLGEGTG